MSKFEVGSQWKTRGGWRAVVVDLRRDVTDVVLAYHPSMSDAVGHRSNGKTYRISGVCSDDDRDLMEPWKEPVVHEGWINIYLQDEKMFLPPCPFSTKDKALQAPSENRIACIKIGPFKEGEGL